MRGKKEKTPDRAEEQRITVSLPKEIAERLASFCRELKVPPDRVVERALIEYFREGDMSH